jgi:polyisoprenoid-binding protein YceI
MSLKPWRAALACAATCILILSATARADTWRLDPAHTSVEFTVRHMMLSNVKGRFDKLSGTVTANGTDPNSVQVNAVIEADSINTRVAKRDSHLRSADFLDVVQYPTITFKSTKVEPVGNGKWKLTGDLTLHGVTKPVVLDVTGPTPPIKDPMGNTRVGASATTTIDRKDFGITWNHALDGGGMLVGDDVSISIEVEAIKQ